MSYYIIDVCVIFIVLIMILFTYRIIFNKVEDLIKTSQKSQDKKDPSPLKEEITSHPYHIGENYFLRTVTHHYTGKLVAVYPQELLFEVVAWIADDGRFADALKTGVFNEIEPFPKGKQVIIGRGSLIDGSTLDFPLPTMQK
jgi:hypothetical protein